MMFNWNTFLVYILVMTFTPGPNNIMAMATAGKYGFKKALEYSAGVFTGFFLVMLLSSYFNLMFFNLIPKIQPVMQWIGAGFMVYLAFKIMMPAAETVETAGDNEKMVNQKLPSVYLTALSIQFINPKGILYAVMVVSNFIIPYYQSHLAFFLFSFLLAFISILSTASWASFGSLFNKFLTRYQRPFNIAMGMLLIYSALSVLDMV